MDLSEDVAFRLAGLELEIWVLGKVIEPFFVSVWVAVDVVAVVDPESGDFWFCQVLFMEEGDQ